MAGFSKGRRVRNLYEGTTSQPFTLSRSKIDLFVQCARCFWLDVKKGVSRPPSIPLTLNNAVDGLLKKEFDMYRSLAKPHPIMKEYGVDAIPLSHEKMDEWRDALRRGISYHHIPTNLILRGGVDDVWVDSQGNYIIVDYKATAKSEEITLDDEWKIQYKRQMEIYQWLFKKAGYPVSSKGYFLYVNGKLDHELFDAKLEFDITLLPYEGNDSWIEPTLKKLKETLDSPSMPASSSSCDFCMYARMRAEEAGFIDRT